MNQLDLQLAADGASQLLAQARRIAGEGSDDVLLAALVNAMALVHHGRMLEALDKGVDDLATRLAGPNRDV